MRIAVIASFWPSKQNPISGIAIAEQVGELMRAGHQVRVFIVAPRNQEWLSLREMGLTDESFSPLPSDTSPADLPYYSLNLRPIFLRSIFAPPRIAPRLCWLVNLWLAPLQMRYRLMGLAPEFWIVHNAYPLGFCTSIWKTDSAPTAVIIRGAEPPLLIPYVQRFVRAIMPPRHSKAMILPVGATLVPYLNDLGIEVSAVQRNGTLPVPEVSGLVKQPSKTIELVTTANLHFEKGVQDLLTALEQLMELNWHLTIVGDGPERTKLEAQANSLNDRVTFLGRLPRPETLAVMSTADIFVLPSHRESFGLVFLESAIRGIPSIGCYNTGAAETIVNNVTGFLVDIQSPEQLAEKLRLIICNPQLREKFGSNAATHAKQHTWKAYNHELLLKLQNL